MISVFKKTQRAVVKVGGSLFDLPDLRDRLNTFFDKMQAASIVLVAGGGAAADAVRAWDATYKLCDKNAHWLAIRALSLTAFLLKELVPNAELVRDWRQLSEAMNRSRVVIIDPFHFAEWDEQNEDHLPHNWSATSDSLAARVASAVGADVLILFKSVDFPGGCDWTAASRRGFVDEHFPIAIACHRYEVHAVNLKLWQPDASKK